MNWQRTGEKPVVNIMVRYMSQWMSGKQTPSYTQTKTGRGLVRNTVDGKNVTNHKECGSDTARIRTPYDQKCPEKKCFHQVCY